jgi:flagellar basal-body rod modification protein FlgD
MGTAAIFSHSMDAVQSLLGSNAGSPVDQATASENASSTSSSSTSSATISANDFLTLLVTEMQNQDPTATTDPNQYINQLVSVNSLEQLIDINQNLSTALGNPSTSSSTGVGVSATGTNPAASIVSSAANGPATTGGSATAASIFGTQPSAQGVLSAIQHVSGNLSVPDASAASQRVGHALNGVTHAQPTTEPHLTIPPSF